MRPADLRAVRTPGAEGSAPESLDPRHPEIREERLQESYRDSGERLFTELAPRLVRTANRVGLSPSEAEDAVQDAFVELWQRRPVVTRIEAWLQRTVRRRSVDQIRKKTRRDRLLAEQPAAGRPREPGPGRLLDDAIALQQALRRLPLEVRLFLSLHYEVGMTEARAAELVGYAGTSGKKLLTRTPRKLERSLATADRRDVAPEHRSSNTCSRGDAASLDPKA